ALRGNGAAALGQARGAWHQRGFGLGGDRRQKKSGGERDRRRQRGQRRESHTVPPTSARPLRAGSLGQMVSIASALKRKTREPEFFGYRYRVRPSTETNAMWHLRGSLYAWNAVGAARHAVPNVTTSQRGPDRLPA